MHSSQLNEHTSEVIVLGAGLCGLAIALLLHEQGRSVHLLEARSVAGGRIRSVHDDTTGRYLADLGPTWVWPNSQPVLQSWINKLKLDVFPQYDAGNAVLDYGPEQPAKSGFIPGQDGNMRVAGGSQALINTIIAKLPADMISLNTPATSVNVSASEAIIRSDNNTFVAKHLVVAIPPRIALKTIEWKNELPLELQHALDTTPTWMAPHAKVVAIYENPFWREQGLSGRIASRTGPIAECHDHCSPHGEIAALWGFIGWPYDMRVKMGEELKSQVRLQLKHCFGSDKPDPLAIHIEEWSQDPFVTSPNDLTGPMHHPTAGPNILRQPHLNDRIFFAGSETAERSPGLIEGAFDAAERVAHNIAKRENTTSPE